VSAQPITRMSSYSAVSDALSASRRQTHSSPKPMTKPRTSLGPPGATTAHERRHTAHHSPAAQMPDHRHTVRSSGAGTMHHPHHSSARSVQCTRLTFATRTATGPLAVRGDPARVPQHPSLSLRSHRFTPAACLRLVSAHIAPVLRRASCVAAQYRALYGVDTPPSVASGMRPGCVTVPLLQPLPCWWVALL
jgi:hypothetical protein